MPHFWEAETLVSGLIAQPIYSYLLILQKMGVGNLAKQKNSYIQNKSLLDGQRSDRLSLWRRPTI